MSQISFIHGFHAIIAKLRHQPDAILEVFIDAERHDARMRDLMRHAELHAVKVVAVDSKRLEGMAGGGMRHQGVVAKVSSESRHVTLDDVLDTLEEPAFLLVLDGIQDPHNLGACLRVADAVGAHAVIAPKDRAVGLTQTAIKVASGAAESVPYITVTNLARTLRELKEREIWVVGTDAEAKEDAEPEEKFVPKTYNGKAPKAGKGKKDKPKKATPKPAPKSADEEQLTFGDFGTEEAAG